MTAPTGMQLAEMQRLFQTKGLPGLEDLEGEAFLVDIPTQSPGGSYSAADSTRAGTVEYAKSVLLDLGRSAAGQTSVWPISDGSTIGRSSSNDVSYPADESLSKRHARFVFSESAWHLEDDSSTNGCFIGADRVESGGSSQVVSPAVVQIGARRFMFLTTEHLAGLFSPVDSLDPIPADQLRSELQALGSRRFQRRHSGHYLLLSYGGATGASGRFEPDAAFPLLGEGPLSIGRTSQADLTIRSKSVSKWHARMHTGAGRWALEDTGSSNGTRINGRVLPAHTATSIASWDAVSIGNRVHGLFLSGPALLEHFMDA